MSNKKKTDKIKEKNGTAVEILSSKIKAGYEQINVRLVKGTWLPRKELIKLCAGNYPGKVSIKGQLAEIMVFYD